MIPKDEILHFKKLSYEIGNNWLMQRTIIKIKHTNALPNSVYIINIKYFIRADNRKVFD